MTTQRPTRLILSAGTTTLALILTAVLPASVAAPLPEAVGKSSPSVSQSNLVSPTPVPGDTASSSGKGAKSPLASEPAPQNDSGFGASDAEKNTEDGQPVVDVASTPDSSRSATPTASAEDAKQPGGADNPAPGANPTQGVVKGTMLKIQVDGPSVKPGEVYAGSVDGIPEGKHIAVSLVPGEGLESDSVSCSVGGGSPSQTFECSVPQGQISGRYTLEVRLLDGNNRPVTVDGAEVIDTSHSVMVVDASKEYSPQLVAQYPITAAGYIMPIAGGGYKPHSEVVIRGLDAEGNPVPGVTFAERPSDGVSPVAELDSAGATLKVTTDANGFFSAYLVTSPYMTSSTVNVVAQDEKTKVSASDHVGVLGESVARLRISTDTVVAGEDDAVEISGNQFAPFYKNYLVTLQLVRDGQVITSQDIELSSPSGEDLWSSFEKTTLTQTASLEPGEYSIQAVVPRQDKIPVEFRGRLLASKTFTVTSPDAVPPLTANPTNPAEPLPGDPVETGAPTSNESTVPDNSEPTETEELGGGEAQSTPIPVPSESTGAVPEPEEAIVAEGLVAPAIEQTLPPEPTEPTINQNPAWVQTSSIKADDPRVIQEPNPHLKSSVLSAQGAKSVEGRVNPQSLVEAPGSVSPVNGATAVVNLNRSTSKWPVLVLLLVALGVGAVTGAFISKTTRATDTKR